MYREMTDYELINRYKAGERDFSDVTLLSRYQGMKPSSHVGLNTAQLYDADLTGADLTEAMLAGAALNRSKFHQAKLRGANLGATDMRDTEFNGADLTEAVFGKATGSPSFSGAVLDRTNFYDAGPDIRQFFDVIIDEAAPSVGTITPDGRTLPSVGRAPRKRSSGPSVRTMGGTPAWSRHYVRTLLLSILVGAFFGAVFWWADARMAAVLAGALAGAATGLVLLLLKLATTPWALWRSIGWEFTYLPLGGALYGLPITLVLWLLMPRLLRQFIFRQMRAGGIPGGTVVLLGTILAAGRFCKVR